MSVHYKFKSAISYDTITFDGLHISVKDLKKAILHQKQIGKNTDFDLQVTNAQTNEEFNDEQTLIPKNTSLIVSRIPLTTQQKRAWERAEQNNQLVLSKQISNLDSHEPDSVKLKGADLLGSNASEEDKINAMMAQSTQEYDPSNFVKIRGGNQYGEVPPNYVCHRCHNPGHWIKNCPNNNTASDPIDIKKATGIPRGFLVPVDGPSVPGAMLTGSGTFAVPSIDQEAYKQSMKPQKKQETEEEKVIIPEDLLCILCSDLLTDAIMMPCCGTSFCDECIRNALLESEENECPDCHGKEISPETLIPNRYLRNAVNGFKDKTGYSKRIEAAKEKVIPPKVVVSVPQINIEPPPKEEVIIPASTQSPPSDSSIEVPRDEIYQKIAAVGDPSPAASVDIARRNYSAIGTINNVNNSHNQPSFKPQAQSQAQSQGPPPVSMSNNSRPNNTNVHIPANNAYQNIRHAGTKSTDSRVTQMSRFNSQSLSIPPHPHMRSCLPIGPADISVPPPPFAHPPPSIQPDGYNQMQPIHNPPPPGLDRNSSPANASSDEGMHPPESSRHHMEKFENPAGSLQPMLRTGYGPGYYPAPISNYDPYNMPMDMRNRGYHRGGYSRRPTRGQQMGSNYRPDYRNGGNYINNRRTIDDPLAVFQRILRERDNKRRDMRVRHSMSRSRSRSLTPRSRSRERSRSLSRSPSRIMKHRTRSISRSPLPRNRSLTPRRRSRTRSRSPVRKRKKSLSPVKRLPMKTRRRTRSPSRDIQGRRSRSLSLHRRTRSRSRSPVHRNRMSPSPRFRSRSPPTFYTSPVRFSNYHREEDNFGPKGSNWRGRGTCYKGTQQYQQSHSRYRGQFDGHYDIPLDRPTDFAANYAQFNPHFAMDPNLVRDWDEIRDKEIREREKEKKEEEEKLKKKSKSQSPVKHHKVEKQRQEHKPSPEKNHKDSDKKDKGKRKKKKDADIDKKKKKKSSREKKDKDDGKKEDESHEEEVIKMKIENGTDVGNEEPAAPGTSESPPPFETCIKEEAEMRQDNDDDNVADGLYGDLDEVAPVDTSWGNYNSPEENVVEVLPVKPEPPVDEKPKEPEVLAELPERSKWEVEEDVSATEDKSDGEKQKPESAAEDADAQSDDGGGGHVTNEVLKRAENAIFQKTLVRTLDAGGKKAAIAMDKGGDGSKDKKTAADVVKDGGKKTDGDKRAKSKEKKPEVVVAKDKKCDAARERKQETAVKDNGNNKKASDNNKRSAENNKDKKQSEAAVSASKDKKRDTSRDKKRDSSDRRDGKKPADNKKASSSSSRRDDYGSHGRDNKKRTAESPNSETVDSLTLMQREARKSGNSIQITIPTDSVDETKKTGGGKETVTKRISAKDRLGDKVLDDKDDAKQQQQQHYAAKSRSDKRKASRSPIRVHSTLIVPEPLARKMRANSKSRGSGGREKDRTSKSDRTVTAAAAAAAPSSSSAGHRTSRRDEDKKSVSAGQQRKKSSDARSGGRTVVRSSATADDNKNHHHRPAAEQQKSGGGSGGGGQKKDADRCSDKKSDRSGGKKEEKREEVKKSSKPSRDKEQPAVAVAEKKERKNRRLESDRDDARKDDDDDEVASDVAKKTARNNRETDDSASSSSSSSSSSDSSPVRPKKRKKAKKRKKKHEKKKKKKAVVASSSDSDDTDSSEESDESAGNKHKKKKKESRSSTKKHKKQVKKKKKSKHR